MHVPHWVTTIVVILVLVAGGLAIRSAIERAGDVARHDEQIKAEHEIQKVKDQSIVDLKKQNETIVQQQEQHAKDLQKQMDAVNTAAQAASSLAKAFPKMPPQSAPVPADSVPNSPGALKGKWLISDEQMLEFNRCGFREQQCASKLAAEQEVEANLNKIIAADNEKLKAKDAELSTERNNNHGGSIGQRIKRKLKPIACSAIGAGAGALSDKQHPARNAAVGSLIGGIACAIF